MTKSSYRTADGVYVEFWHDYKTAANLKNIAIAPPQRTARPLYQSIIESPGKN